MVDSLNFPNLHRTNNFAIYNFLLDLTNLFFAVRKGPQIRLQSYQRATWNQILDNSCSFFALNRSDI